MKAQQYAAQWNTLATASGHITSTYNPESSHALIYNLYPDRLFNFGLVPDDARFIHSLAQSLLSRVLTFFEDICCSSKLLRISPFRWYFCAFNAASNPHIICVLGPKYGLPTDDETHVGRSRTCLLLS